MRYRIYKMIAMTITATNDIKNIFKAQVEAQTNAQPQSEA